MQFKNVVGQAELKRRLIDEVNNKTVAHAQLFLGKSGYGGLPLALAFTQYLFCEAPQENDSCNECNSCKKISKLQHPDVHFSFPTVQTNSKISDTHLPEWREIIQQSPYFDLLDWTKFIDPKERKPIIGKDESQEIIKKLMLRSYEGGFKVMIIWMAEEMNISCANKLLKIIEEPPAKTLFLLIAESQDKMLQTILSRTQLTKIPRLKTEEVSTYLSEKFNLNSSNTESIATRVEGDLIEATTIYNNQSEGSKNRELFTQLMRVCYKKNVLEMMDWANETALESRAFQKDFLTYSLHMFRQSMLRNYTEEMLTSVSEEEGAFLKNFSRFITGNNLSDFMKAFSEAHYHIDRNANPKILFTNLCFEVMRYIHRA